MEPKAKTLQERFGFSDPDLKTPKHDAIMVWLNTTMRGILDLLFKPEWDFIAWSQRYSTSKELDILVAKMREDIAVSLDLPAQPKRSIWVKWESPILDRTFTIGFSDMEVVWEDQRVTCEFDVKGNYLGSEINIGLSRRAYFEVKPLIPSAGELIRQLRMYQTYTGNAQWFVVSPDNRFESIIKDQGFGFVLVPESVGQL